MKLVYPAIFIPWKNKNGYTVEIPDLPGCISEGHTLAEAIEMGADAASGWILDELEDGNNYPAPSDFKKIQAPSGAFVSLLLLDMDAYTEKYGNHSTRKNLTHPAWQTAATQ